ncbi:hypothetical protein IW261DRAFT_826501 [Armillaria novae-zelandiae]|uniref:Uncharacterized protein n=1 Tax=Armillaria novae-zelandiae TaxID=153914 RepID=A0AA39NU56_9AGAR|nr:hypothetical protein IW261DRAFT_826501 [Armillaria novae-zelandiae]
MLLLCLLSTHQASASWTIMTAPNPRLASLMVVARGYQSRPSSQASLFSVASAGLASSLLVWLQSRRVGSHIPREDPYFKNALVAIEGATASRKLDDGSLESDTTIAADLWLHTTASTFIHTSMTPIGMESLPNAGTKINLTILSEVTSIIGNGDYYYYRPMVTR